LNNSAGANQSKPESKPFSLNKSSEDAPEHAPDPDHMEVPPEGSYALEASGLEEQNEQHDKTPFSEEDPIALADEIAKKYPHDEPPKDQEYHEEADLAEQDIDVNETTDPAIIKAMESEDPPTNITKEIKPALIEQEAEDGTEDEDMMADDMSAEDLEAETPQDGPKVSEVKPPDEAAQEVAQVEEEEDDPIKLAEEVAKK